MIIRSTNNLDVNSLNSFLSNSVGSAVGTLPVKNINAFQSNWAIQLGKTGEETAEIVVLGTTTPSGTTLITTANTRYPHPTDTPVYALKYDQVIFSRSTTGTTGTAYDLTNGTVSITPDSQFTQIDDPLGLTTYAYKARYRNSVLGVSYDSPDSDWITSTGFSFWSKAKLKERTKGKLLDAGYIKDDTVIDDWLNEWLEVMNNVAVQVDKSYGMGTVDVAFGTSGLGTITSDDFISIKRMWVTYNGSDYYVATQTDINNIRPSQTFNETHPYFSWRGDTTFKVDPEQSGGTARIDYYNIRTKLVDDADELPVVMRPYTRSFVDYALSEALYQDSKEARADRYSIRAENDKKTFTNQITPRNNTGVQMITIDVATSDDDFLDLM